MQRVVMWNIVVKIVLLLFAEVLGLPERKVLVEEPLGLERRVLHLLEIGAGTRAETAREEFERGL